MLTTIAGGLTLSALALLVLVSIAAGVVLTFVTFAWVTAGHDTWRELTGLLRAIWRTARDSDNRGERLSSNLIKALRAYERLSDTERAAFRARISAPAGAR